MFSKEEGEEQKRCLCSFTLSKYLVALHTFLKKLYLLLI